jgi:endoglucanase
MAPAIFAAGVAPDMFVVGPGGLVTQDTERAPSGSYDAIRVYLWAGMSGQDSREIVRLIAPYARLISSLGAPPEKVNPATGTAIRSDYSPAGYAGAVLPFLGALHEGELQRAQLARLQLDAVKARLGHPTNYYDQALILFGKGWHDGYFLFDARGQLQPKWRL